MLPLSYKRVADWWLGKVQLALGFAVACSGAILATDAQHFRGALGIDVAIEFGQRHAWIVVVAAPFVVFFIQVIRRRITNPWAWEAIEKILNEIQSQFFQDKNGLLDHNRVTLFKYKKLHMGLCNPCGWHGWLVAVARSGHLRKRKIRKFRAPDDGDQCEGVVGQAWRSNGVWVTAPESGSPIEIPSRYAADNEIEKFAQETFVSKQWVKEQLKNGRPLSSSYAAIMILLKGKPWGVLVLDSRSSTGIDIDKIKDFKVFGSILTPLLERV